MRRWVSGPAQGAALALYFVLTPYVVVEKWSIATHRDHGAVLQLLLVALAGFWLAFVVQVARGVARLRHGEVVPWGGTAWLAGLIVALLTLWPPLGPPPRGARPVAHVTATARAPLRPGLPSRPTPAVGLEGLPLALAVRQRTDRLRRDRDVPAPDEVDALITATRSVDPALLGRLRHVIGDSLDGLLRVSASEPGPQRGDDGRPTVVCLVDGEDPELVSFAREGGRLRVPAQWDDDAVRERVVGLHDGGRVVCTRDDGELLHALAVRAVRHQLVVYLGDADAIEPALRASAVTLERAQPPDDLLASYEGRLVAAPTAPVTSEVVVELLRADPVVRGLAEPFSEPLRRRCIEMTTYLALHAHEPVTGERLRSRVLSRADAEASARTLMNVATAVRRSLGTDARGSRLHPVSSSGLYQTHGVTTDVGRFHHLVAEARTLSGAASRERLESALALVQGEPLACALRGFDWFLAEGHAARLQRDGEWAALAVHDAALRAGDVELAYWALERGRLLDPYSTDLAEALARVPRLRQFGGDGARTA